MALFLERVKAFPSCKFVLVNTEMLDSRNLEILLTFLSDRESASLGISFHCIQRGDNLIHTAPWIEGKTWDSSSPSKSNPAWEDRILNDMSISVVSSQSCGTGKTRFIREMLSDFKAAGQDRKVASIIVHETSSICSLIEALKRKFPGSSSGNALHVSFAVLPSRDAKNEEWMREINRFFFSLMVLRAVYDPLSATSFTLTGEEWLMLVEVPGDWVGETAEHWFQKNIPIVAAYATFLAPIDHYVIDNEARRVCTYLRAFANGTINRKFEGGAAKRIVLVLDCSGSMDGTPFLDAVANAVGIFDSHVAEGDVSNLLRQRV